MAILSSVGNHVELNSIDKQKKATTIFPLNTADDVLIDDNGNSLTDTLPQIRGANSEDASGALDATEIEEIIIEDTTLISRLTTNEAESFDDVNPPAETV